MKILMLVVVSFLVSPSALAAMNSGSTSGTACSANYKFQKQGSEQQIAVRPAKGHGHAIVVK